MRLIQAQQGLQGTSWPTNSQLNSQGYPCPEWSHVDWQSSSILFDCGWARDVELPPGWVNLSVPWTAPNYHIRNLELLVEQGIQFKSAVWVMPEPQRVTVFDLGDRVRRWGVTDESGYGAQGQTPGWDQALRLRIWQRAADQLFEHNHWMTTSQLTHQLVGWQYVSDHDQLIAKLKTLG